MSKEKVTIGYVRISTPKQKLQRQIDSIKEAYPDAVIVEEIFTGTSTDRPKWKSVMKSVKRGDVKKIVFDEISRMSRDAADGYKTYKFFLSKDVEMIFLREPHLNSETYKAAKENRICIDVKSGDKYTDEFLYTILNSLNEYMLNLVERQIELAFERSQQEVEYIRERTKAGIRAARARGSIIGRPYGSTITTKKYLKSSKKIAKNYKLFGGELNATDCMRICNISRDTFYRYVDKMIRTKAASIPDEKIETISDSLIREILIDSDLSSENINVKRQ